MAVIVRGKQASMQKQNWRAMHGEEQMHHSCELVPVLAIKIIDSSYYKIILFSHHGSLFIANFTKETTYSMCLRPHDVLCHIL